MEAEVDFGNCTALSWGTGWPAARKNRRGISAYVMTALRVAFFAWLMAGFEDTKPGPVRRSPPDAAVWRAAEFELVGPRHAVREGGLQALCGRNIAFTKGTWSQKLGFGLGDCPDCAELVANDEV
jgi:hypothetical protein